MVVNIGVVTEGTVGTLGKHDMYVCMCVGYACVCWLGHLDVWGELAGHQRSLTHRPSSQGWAFRCLVFACLFVCLFV